MRRSSVIKFARSLSLDHESMIEEIFDVGNQEHLFENWEKWSNENSVRLLNQLKSLNDDYAGGLRSYVENARHLLKAGGTRENQRTSVKIPKGTVLTPGEKSFERAERSGLEIVHECAFVSDVRTLSLYVKSPHCHSSGVGSWRTRRTAGI